MIVVAKNLCSETLLLTLLSVIALGATPTTPQCAAVTNDLPQSASGETVLDYVPAWEKVGAEFGEMSLDERWGFEVRPNVRSGGLPAFSFGKLPQGDVIRRLPQPEKGFGLYLRSSDLTADTIRELANLKHLSAICLAFTAVEDSWLAVLSTCESLRSVSLCGCRKLTDSALKQLAACKQLQELNRSNQQGKCFQRPETSAPKSAEKCRSWGKHAIFAHSTAAFQAFAPLSLLVGAI